MSVLQKKSVFVLLLCLAAIAGGVVAADRGAGQDGGAASAGGEAAAEELDLFEHMLQVKALVRDLAGLAGDASKKVEALPVITQLQGHIIAAKQLTPPAAETRPEGERAAFNLAFRKSMTELLREVAELELDIIEDRNAEAAERITKKLIEMRDAAHELFQ